MNKYFRVLSCFWQALIFFNVISISAQTIPKYYYVATDGNDSNPGTESLPLKTLAKAASLATSGATVFIRQGTYNEQFIPLNSGTVEAPIVFASYPGDTATITGVGIDFPSGEDGLKWWNGLVYVEGLKYIRISGLKIINSEASGILVRNSSNITLERNLTDNTFSPGISINESENIVVEGNEVVHGCSGNDQESISVTLTNLFEIKNNSVHDGITEGIDVKVGSSNGIVNMNEVYNQNAQRNPPGIYIDAWDGHEFNIDVFDNICHDNGHGFSLGSENGGLLEGIRIHHNKAYNNDRGLWLAGFGIGQRHLFNNIEISGNEIYDNLVGIEIGGYFGTTMDTIEVLNNLICKNNGVGVRVTRYGEPTGDYSLRNISINNNTIYHNGTLGNGWDADNGGINIFNFLPENMIIRNNIYGENAVGTIHIAVEIPSESVNIDYNFFDGFQNLVDERAGTNPVYGTTLFVNAPGNDYHLQAASPAIDKGDPDQQYNDPEDPGNPGYALSPALGTIRNDMGAYGGPFASSWDPNSYASIPPAPVQVFPITNATGVPTTLLVGWNSPWGATSYRLQVSTNSDFSTMVLDSNDIKGSSCAIRDLANNEQYFWRVKATNAAGTGSFSGTWSFSTATTAGINDKISDETIRIYPVPVAGNLKIDGIDDKFTTISILSHEGKLLKQIKGSGIQEIDISEFQKGVYLVKISNSRIVITKKIVKL